MITAHLWNVISFIGEKFSRGVVQDLFASAHLSKKKYVLEWIYIFLTRFLFFAIQWAKQNLGINIYRKGYIAFFEVVRVCF